MATSNSEDIVDNGTQIANQDRQIGQQVDENGSTSSGSSSKFTIITLDRSASERSSSSSGSSSASIFRYGNNLQLSNKFAILSDLQEEPSVRENTTNKNNVQIGDNGLAGTDSRTNSTHSSPNHTEPNSPVASVRQSGSSNSLVASDAEQNNADASGENAENNDNNDENSRNQNSESAQNISDMFSELMNEHPELRSIFMTLGRHLLFLSIILIKVFADLVDVFSRVVFMGIIFTSINSILKKSISERKYITALVMINLNTCMLLLYFYFSSSDKLFYCLIFIPPQLEHVKFSDLLWIVLTLDYEVKIITVHIKFLLHLLPKSILCPNRGKYYFTIEMTSQLYRSLLPIQPWISYLIDSEDSSYSIVGIILCIFYAILKTADLVQRWKAFQSSVVKLIQNVNYGIIPTKSQIEDAGGQCPICHDKFVIPTMLKCNHIFCEQCAVTWFSKKKTCPMCRTKVADDPVWRDGGTTHFLQLF